MTDSHRCATQESPTRRAATTLVLAALALALGGCATVPPYERGTLARKDMQLERNGDAAAGQNHADAYREGSAGGEGASGGGCGCN